jgi:hypothetical protein
MTKTTEKTETVETGEAVKSTIKNFKNSSDVKDFYRFIHENNLRSEARTLVGMVLKTITPPKKRGRKKATLQ